ncbi:MAG TPA: bifunctional diguanylate cyclase/phosphodiesterase [Solirubrobacteraceae bacterium]|nr:bifunctional diguanylate cyclase/phosphodiesterase [Solirubrobacteraceae bacterium]
MSEAAARRHLSAVPSQAPGEPAPRLDGVADALAAPLAEIAELAALALSAPGTLVAVTGGGEHGHGTLAARGPLRAAVARLCAEVVARRATRCLADASVAAGGPWSFAAAPVLLGDGAAVACLAAIAEAGREWAPRDLRLLEGLAARAATEVLLAEGEADAEAFDPLTGLVARAAFLDRVDEAIGDAGMGCALLYVDVDDHRGVAEAFGPAAGDALLVQVSDRLRAVLRPTDLAARMGGSAFTALCRDVPDAATVERIARRVREAMAAPFAIEGRERPVAVTVDGRMAEPTDRRAAPRPGQARAILAGEPASPFTDQIRDSLLRSLRLEEELRAALDHGDLRLHYQPIVSLRDGGVLGAECLLRWQHPDAGLLAPADFLPVAEDSSLMGPIARWTIEEALRQTAEWRAAGLPAPNLSLNLSPLQLAEPGLAGHVVAAARRHDVPLETLCVEVTEDALIGPGPALEAVWGLREAGAYVAIDDFGTGYSSLAYLKRLPVDLLKIDRRFVSGLGSDPDDAAIVAAIMSLGAAMGIHVTAEGVETPEQADALRALGCDHVQGFLFAPALPAGELAALAAQPSPFAA